MRSLLRIAALAAWAAASGGHAHDRHGNAAMHQNVHVLIEKDHVEVTCQIETNEDGMMVEAVAMDANGDGKLAPEEQSAYFAQLDARLREGLQIRVEETDVALESKENVELTPPARKTFHFRGALPSDLTQDALLLVFNDNFLDWPGKTALDVEPGSGVMILFRGLSTTHAAGSLTIPTARPSASVQPVTWWLWSWRNTFVSQGGIVLVVALLATLTLLMVFRAKLSRADLGVVSGLIVVCLAGGVLYLVARNPNPASEVAWRGEFCSFHERLTEGLESFHQGAGTGELASLCSKDSLERLLSATRVVKAGDESSGTFDLHGFRQISTRILKTPRNILDPIFRVHHEWRAIGLMRHEGHPHERIRDFSCDYTLRVTDHGFQLVDCSDWHQLPDEPME